MVSHGKKERVNWTIENEAMDHLKDLSKRTNITIGNLVSKIILDHKRTIVQKLLDEKRMMLIRIAAIDSSIKSIHELANDEDARMDMVAQKVIKAETIEE